MQVPQNLLNGPAATTDKSAGSSASEQGNDGGAFSQLYKSVAQKDEKKGANDGHGSAEGRTANAPQETSHGDGAAVLARLIGDAPHSGPSKTKSSTDGPMGIEVPEGAISNPARDEDGAGAGNPAFAALLASAPPMTQVSRPTGIGIPSKSNGGSGSAALHMALRGQLKGEGQVQSAGVPGSETVTATIDQVEGGTETLFSRFAVKPEAVSPGAGSRTERGAVGKHAGDSIEVVRQETHFAPSQRIPPIQQVGQALSEALANGQASQGGRAAPPFGDTGQLFAQPSGSAVKILEIRLQPQELGTVRVTMRIVEDRLQVDVRSANPQTVELLQKDKHMLDRLLHASGYKADSVTVQGIGDDRSPFQITAGPNAQNVNSGNGQGEGRSASQSGGNAPSGEGRQGSQQNSGEDTRHTQDHRDTGAGPEVRMKDSRTDGQELYL
ncbi:flagellar hook-length control protein FliK [Breoghania sp.]|uniref:flagellar hook-length control protein FliK n=1 Tax=Breoghania sp. TaxID=2065378 RepID=UPI002AAB277C|nr:flagellar hook-length control protein FliK [Breoghania sp.]